MSFLIVPTSPQTQNIVGLFLFSFKEEAKQGASFLKERVWANKYCLHFFRYLCFSWSDEHLSKPQVLVISPVVSTACKSSLIWALREETLLFTDGQREKKTNHSRIKSTASYLIISRFEQLVLQKNQPHDLLPPKESLASKRVSAWVLSTTSSSSRSLTCQVSEE